MKITSILTSAILAAVLTAGLQAYAVTTIWSDGSTISRVGGSSVGLPKEIEGAPYNGSITWASLVTGGGSAYNGQTLSGGTLAVDITGDNGVTINASIGGISLGSVTGNGGWSDFSLNSATETYIEDLTGSHTISFSVEADCDMQGYYLSLTSTNSGSTVPDGGSTMALLGGVLTTLGLIKRKMA